MGVILGRGLQRQRNHMLHVVIGNRSESAAARFIRQAVQSQFQEPRTPLSPPSRRTPPGWQPPSASGGLLRPLAQPIITLTRSVRAYVVFGRRTHHSRVFLSASSKITGGIGHQIAMVIALWAADPEGTSFQTLLLLTSVTPR